MLSRLLLAGLAFAATLALPVPGLSAVSVDPAWTTPFPPYRVIGNIYYVGSKDLAADLTP